MSRRIARTRIDRVPALSETQRVDMLALMSRYYDGVEPTQFARDLDEKDHVIRMLDAQGGLCGFSTVQRLPLEWEGRRLMVVFSGDTVIDRECWGQKSLQQAFTRYLVRTWLRHARRRVYWFLMTKGFKTYLLMRNNFSSYPNYREETPAEIRAVLDAVATRKYPDQYDPDAGVIRFPGEAQAVKEAYHQVGPAEQEDPEVRYFLDRNPGFGRGDELCCLARVRGRELAWIAAKYGVWHPLRRLLRPRRR